MGCEFFVRMYKGSGDSRLLVEKCSLTGRACFMDELSGLGLWQKCDRRLWALALDYQRRHPQPETPE